MRPALAAAIATIFLSLAACGEKDEPEATGPVVTAESTTQTGSTTTGATTKTTEFSAEEERRKVAVVIEDFLVSADAASVCDGLLTPEFLSKAYGNRQGCISARKSPTLATAARVGEVNITSGNGDKATTPAYAEGGAYEGQRLTFFTVRSGENWRISGLQSNAAVGP